MPKRRKPGPKSHGLTVRKTFMITPAMNRQLAAITPKYGREGVALRAAVEALFLAHNVQVTDNSVQSNGHTELQAA